MKKTILAAALATAALFNAPGIHAVPARPGVMERTMADGSTVKVRLAGDEFYHYYLSEDGYLLVDRGGILYYGDVDSSGAIVSSDFKATDKATRPAEARNFLAGVDMSRVGQTLDRRRSLSPRLVERATKPRQMRAPAAKAAGDEGYPLGPGLFPGTSFPSKGDQKALVILVQYKDKKFTLDNPHDYFSRMLNETGFSDYGGTGCAKEYFELCSDNLFRPEFDVVGPVTLSQNMSYYGGNDWWGNDQHPEEMVIEACQQLDSTVDFSEYDRDGDGYIDNVFLFYAGQGEASYGSENTVWPHSWDITSATSTPYYFDGVRLDRYGCTNEWEQNRPDGVGTFIHEFSHVMGLPDLYATSYTSAFTPGGWSALDYGPYNNDGMTPPLYGAFERYALGWNAPVVLDRPMNATLPQILDNVTAIIKTTKANEFFLLENRQQTSWDTYIPGHGMLVWHIDYNTEKWEDNVVNNTTYHQYVDIVEADNTQSENSRAGDTFPGTKNVTSLTATTSPSLKMWGGTPVEVPLTEIAESADGVITFKVMGGREDYVAVTVGEPENITDDSFTATWTKTDAPVYLLSVFTVNDKGDRTYVEGFDRFNAGNADRAEVTGLEPDTEYYYTVTASYGLELTPESDAMAVYTGAAGINRLKVEALEGTDVTHNSFTATWNHLEGASDYILTVYKRDYEGAFESTVDFTDGASTLPEGFTSSSASTYANASYSGDAIPALRLATSGDHLSATFADGIRGLRFWHRGNGTSEGDVINVYAIAGSSRPVVAEIPVVSDKGGCVTEITEFPENTRGVRIEFVRTGTKGSLAIDDVTVSHGTTAKDTALPAYDGITTGYTDSYKVEGLDPECDYFYKVAATDGTRTSRHSDLVKVTTLKDMGQSGIIAAEAAETRIDISGRELTATAGGTITVTTISGHVIATASGTLHVTLPTTGIYIVATPAGAKKILIHD
ncbi:MAG: M6 family metalloprotease domain-containing protein [Duncaniella sp.]|nr:M6 family metalloprotease domain-containing protein [Duncaniella sp.]